MIVGQCTATMSQLVEPIMRARDSPLDHNTLKLKLLLISTKNGGGGEGQRSLRAYGELRHVAARLI